MALLSDNDVFGSAGGNALLSDDDVFGSTTPKKQNKGLVADIGTDLKRGVQNIPSAITGLADIPVAAVTGSPLISAAAEGLGKMTGFQPGQWAKEAEQEYSEGRKQARQNIDAAWKDGTAGDIASAYLQNPSQIVGSIAESLPSMLVGGLAGRAALGIGGRAVSAGAGGVGPALPGAIARTFGEKLAPAVGAGLGEGAVMAGQAMDNLTEQGVDPRTAAGYAAGTGLVGAAIGAGGGKVAQMLGVVDPETAIAGGAARAIREGAAATKWQAAKETGKNIIGGGISEGIFEELPQSVMEQAFSNLAQGKPIGEGVARAGVEGALAGFGMGSGFNAIPAKPQGPLSRAVDAGKQSGSIVDPAAIAAAEQYHQRADVIPAGSFGQMNEFANFLNAEQSDIADRREAVRDTIPFQKADIPSPLSLVDEANRQQDGIPFEGNKPQAPDWSIQGNGSFANQAELANLIESEKADLGSRRSEVTNKTKANRAERAQQAIEGDMAQDELAPKPVTFLEKMIASRSDEQLAGLASDTQRPVVQKAAKQEIERRAAKPISQWSPEELQSRLDRSDSGESPLSQESRSKIEAELGSRKAKTAKPKNTGISVGKTLNSSEPVTVKNGVVYVGTYPAMNYETEEDITAPDNATPQQIADALRAGGALGSSKIFGLKQGEQVATQAQPLAQEAPQANDAQAGTQPAAAQEAEGVANAQGSQAAEQVGVPAQGEVSQESAPAELAQTVSVPTQVSSPERAQDGATEAGARSTESLTEPTDDLISRAKALGMKTVGVSAEKLTKQVEEAESFNLSKQTNEQAAAEYKRQQEEANKKDEEPAAPAVRADQVDLFNTQDSLFNSNRDAKAKAKPTIDLNKSDAANVLRAEAENKISTAGAEAFANGKERTAPAFLTGERRDIWLDGYDKAKQDASNSETTPSLNAADSVISQAKSIEDFGEKLEGARKDRTPSLSKELSDDDISTQPLSKIWPAAEIDAIENTFAAAVAFAARNEIPAKPRKSYLVARWVEKVKMLRSLAAKIVNIGEDKARDIWNKAISSSDFKAKVVLLEAIDRDQWKRIGAVSEHPTAYRFNNDGSKETVPFVNVEIDGKRQMFEGAKSVADVVEKVNGLLGVEQQAKKMQFEVRGYGDRFFINKKGDKEHRKLKEFTNTKDAFAFVKNNYDDLVAAWDGVKDRDNVTKADVRNVENRPRTGSDWRNGKDVTAEQFQDAFGFRGGQFGKWVTQGNSAKERQWMLNQAYDALMDLASIVGLPPKAISLNGSLGLAFGARGSGNAAAHFEPDTLVINLTKTKGAGSLAHEWFHALDNYFSRQRGGEVKIKAGLNAQQAYRTQNFITYRPEPMMVHKTRQSTPITRAKLAEYHTKNQSSEYYNPENWHVDPKHPAGVRPEVERAFAELVEALDASPMKSRAAMNDKAADGYWSRIIERGARAFENFVIFKMMENGYNNDYLANVRNVQDFPRAKERYPYLLPEEVAPIAEAFDNLFSTIKTKETDNGIAMYSKSQGSVSAPMQQSQAEQRINSLLGDKVGRLLIESGIITFTNKGNAYQGATYTNGTIALNLDALSADNFDGVLLHEGFHSTILQLVGEETYGKLMKQLENMLAMGRGAQWVADANAAVPKDTAPENVTEEIAAYAIEQHKNGGKIPSVLQRWVQNFLSAIRTAIIQNMPSSKLKNWAVMNLKAQDLARLAKAGLKSKAAGMESAQREAMAYSKSPDDSVYSMERLKDIAKAFADRVTNEIDKVRGRNVVMIHNNTPASMQMLGWANRRLIVEPNELVKIANKAGFDTDDKIGDLVFDLARPGAMFWNEKNGSLNILRRDDMFGAPALIAIRPDVDVRGLAHLMVTAHKLDNQQSLFNKIASGELKPIYLDTTSKVGGLMKHAIQKKKYRIVAGGLAPENLHARDSVQLGMASSLLSQDDLVKWEQDNWGDSPKFSKASQAIKSAVGSVTGAENRIVGASNRQYNQAQRQFFKNVGRDVERKNIIGRTLDYLRSDFWKKMAVGVMDQFRGLRDLNDNGQAYLLARLSKGTAGAFDALLNHGKLSIRDGVYDADTSGGFLQRLGVTLNGEIDDFLWWTAANRAEKLSQEDRENLFTPQDIAAGKSLATGTTNFDYTVQTGPLKGKVTRNRAVIYADANRVFNEFQKNALDMAEQSGLIDGSTRHLWESEFYVPFYRVSDEDGEFVGAKMGNALVRQQAFKKLKGGTDKLNADLLANTLMNWSHLIEASAKNRAAKASLEAAGKMGAAQRVAATMGEYAKSNGSMLPPGTKGAVWYMDGGKKIEYLVSDPFVMTAITSLEYAGMRNAVMDVMSKFKHYLTIGVTANPAFKIRNLIRDSIQAIGTSDLGYNPITNIKEGIRTTRRDSQEYVSALASGGLIRFGTMLENSEADRVRQLIKSGVKDSTILNNENKLRAFYDQYLEPAVAAYNELGNRSEEINRAALYNQLIKQGKSHAEAALLARDLMDFSLQGSFTTIRFLSQVVPFFNARLQGMYKLGRSTKENPAKLATVIGACAVASIALMLGYDDDEDWKRREDFDRDGYWWFKFGGLEWRIPKPFEVGAVASLAERTLEYMINDEMTGERFRKVMGDLVKNNLSMNPVPQVIKPIIDLYANKDSFTGRPIETTNMHRLEPEMRFNSQTSLVARGLSATTMGALSPVQYDYIARAYFGWLGSFAVWMGDMAARSMSDEPEKPTADYYKLGSFGFAKEAGTGSSRYVSMIYDQAKELEQAHATYRQLVKDGKMGEAQEYMEDNKDKLSRYRSTEAVKKAESRLNEQIRLVEKSNLSADEKRERINAINKQKEQVAMRLAPGLN